MRKSVAKIHLFKHKSFISNSLEGPDFQQLKPSVISYAILAEAIEIMCHHAGGESLIAMKQKKKRKT